MSIIWIVFLKTVSVLLSIIIGFFAGRFSNVDNDSIASLLFYFISPIVFFAIPASTTLTFAALSITLVTFVISSILCLFSYYFFGKYWDDHTKNIIALSAGDANVGYFTLPIAATLFDDYTLGIYMMAVMGVGIYGASVGLYVGMKSAGSVKQNIIKLFKLPILNAFCLGCAFSLMGFELPDFLDDFIYNMRGAYSVLGMIMIGLGVSKLKTFSIDLPFTFATFIAKFLFYPVAINIFIILDKFIMNWYDENYYNALQLLSTAPMATNIIIIANLEKFYPERVAATVLLSMLFALVYMPIMVSIFLNTN